jgi:HK97 gp10 family phage protein
MATYRTGITFENIEKISAQLDKFIRDTNSKAIPIMRTAAEILYAEAKARAPVSKQGKKYGKWAHPPGTLRNSISIGEVWRTRSGISAAVGIRQNQYFTQAPSNLWYARWVEFGTRERTVNNWWGHKGLQHTAGVMPMKPFMRPALVRSRTKIRNTVRYRLEEELFKRG